jgi:hypothetical protein
MTKWKRKKKLKITDSDSKNVKPYPKKNSVQNSKSTSLENRRGSAGKNKEGFKRNPKNKSFNKNKYKKKEDEGEEELEVVHNKQQQTVQVDFDVSVCVLRRGASIYIWLNRHAVLRHTVLKIGKIKMCIVYLICD